MTAWIVAAVLAWACIVLAVLLVGRHRGALREEARLQRAADDIAEKYAAQLAENRQLIEQVASLRAACGREPSLTEIVLATIADLPLTDPEDPR